MSWFLAYADHDRCVSKPSWVIEECFEVIEEGLVTTRIFLKEPFRLPRYRLQLFAPVKLVIGLKLTVNQVVWDHVNFDITESEVIKVCVKFPANKWIKVVFFDHFPDEFFQYRFHLGLHGIMAQRVVIKIKEA